MRKEAFRKMIRMFRINNAPVDGTEHVRIYAEAGDVDDWSDRDKLLQVENYDFSNIGGVYLQFDRNGAERIIKTIDAYNDVLIDSDREEDQYGIPVTFSLPARWFGIDGNMVSRDVIYENDVMEDSPGNYVFDADSPDEEMIVGQSSDALVEFDAYSESTARLVMKEKGTDHKVYLSLNREFLEKIIKHVPSEDIEDDNRMSPSL